MVVKVTRIYEIDQLELLGLSTAGAMEDAVEGAGPKGSMDVVYQHYIF